MYRWVLTLRGRRSVAVQRLTVNYGCGFDSISDKWTTFIFVAGNLDKARFMLSLRFKSVLKN